MVLNAVISRMSKRMKGSLPYLQVLAKSKPKLRKLLIDHVPPSVLAAICECSLNVLKGVIPLAPRQRQRLARYKTHLRALANKRVPKKRKSNTGTLNREEEVYLMFCFLQPLGYLEICCHETGETYDFGP